VAASPSYIPISEAARRLGLTYRRTRILIAEGKLKATETDGHEDGRVRWVVSVRSVAAYARKRRKKAKA
jgi:excisionase family DNA binding protein